MKRFLLILPFVPVLFLACASMGTKVSEPVTYSETIDVAGVSQSVLWTKVIMRNRQFSSIFLRVQESDEKSGVIKCGYYNELRVGGIMGDLYKFRSNCTIEVKDGKVQISFTDLIYASYFSGAWFDRGPVVTENMANIVKEDWAKVAANLKSIILAD
jgi:hypothetical protein